MQLRNPKFVPTIVLLTGIVAGVFAYEAAKAKSLPTSTLAAATAEAIQIDPNQAQPPTQQDEKPSDAKVAAFTLRPSGFEPSEITIPAGKYLLVVRNRTGLDQFALRLERTSGARLQDVRLPRYKRDWKHFLHLTPDTYLLSEVDHPDWVCRITVTPN